MSHQESSNMDRVVTQRIIKSKEKTRSKENAKKKLW